MRVATVATEGATTCALLLGDTWHALPADDLSGWRRHGSRPQRFLEDGDVVETEIAGIGELRNTIRFTD
jgi:2-keto-4-pentenoate hydratase/2-oxohepta-3-ene-1,7-dioic acid hydratase in catechol pathway